MLETVRKVYTVLSPSGRRRLVALVLLMLAAAAVEVLGLVSIYPFASAAIDSRVIHTNVTLAWLYRELGFQDDGRFLIFLAFGSSLGFLAGTSAQAVTQWLITRFAFHERHRLSTELLRRYLDRPFVWLLGQHSSDLMNNVLDAVNDAVRSVIVRLATGLARGLVSLFIVVGLLWMQPLVALVAATVLGCLYKVVYALVRPWAESQGKKRDGHRRASQKALASALMVVKEARTLPLRGYFLAQFAEHSRQVNRLEADMELVSDVPSVAIQTGAFASILGVATLLLSTGRSAATVFPMVGFYALATLRLVPALEHVYTLAIRTRFHLPSLDIVCQELAAPAPGAFSAEGRLPLRQSIRIEGVSFAYPRSPALAVNGVELEIPRGSSLGLVGKSGSGKTTLTDLLSGLLRPAEGRLCIDGVALQPDQVEAWQRNLGYVPQEVCLLDDSVRRNIALGLDDDRIDPAAVERAARAANLHEFIGTLPQGYDTMLGERGVALSGGQRQRVGIARALYHDPDVLIFDEATSALDNATESSVMESIRHLSTVGKTLIVVAHRLSTVAHCERLAVLDGGRLVGLDTPARLRSSCPAYQALEK